MGNVTQILSAIEEGDPKAAEELLPLVYDELRRLAAARLAQEKPGQTLQATALVHDAYLRLVDVKRVQQWESRGHFFAAAAEAMRRILVDRARRKQSERAGGKNVRLTLTEGDLAVAQTDERLLALDEALTELTDRKPVVGRLVELRYFAGLTIDEAAATLCISSRSANRYWTYAKAWLACRIQ